MQGLAAGMCVCMRNVHTNMFALTVDTHIHTHTHTRTYATSDAVLGLFTIHSPYKAREMAKIANFGEKAAFRSVLSIVWAGLVPL